MKIVCVLGSPRLKGNSASIASRFIETAEGLGADVSTFTLNRLKYRGCQACFTCKTKLDHCVLNDDLTEVLDSVRACDALVMSSPVFYSDVCSQLKGFIDRTFSFLKPDYLTNPAPSRIDPGKQMVFILTQGEPDETKCSDIIPKYSNFFGLYGFNHHASIRACGVYEKGDAAKREDIMKLAEESAIKLVSGK